MFKEWFFRFIGYIVTGIILTIAVLFCMGGIAAILWIGMKSIILGISTIIVIILVGLGIYTFYEVKKEYKKK